MSEIFTNITIPNSWVWAKSKQIGVIINGDRGKNYPSRQHYIAMGIPFISAGNLSDGKLAVDSFNYISEEKYNALNNGKLLKGDIIYCIRGTLGKCAIFDLYDKAAIASSLTILRLNESLNRYYVFYFLQSPYGSELIKKFDNGTAQPNLSAESFANYEIPFPPLPEQHRIVSKIEELFSRLDKGIESLKTAQQQLNVYRQAVLKWAFEGKLTNKNVVDGELPEGWKWITFNDVCIKIGDIDHKMPKQVEGAGFPYLSTKDFSDDLKVSFDNAKKISGEDYLNLSKKIKPEKGDIIFPRYGTIGKNVLVDFDKEFLVSYSCAIIKLNHNLIEPKYAYYYSLSSVVRDEIKKYTVETTQANIGIASIKRFVFPLPKIVAEQQAIVQEIESRLSVCDKIEESLEQSLKQSEALRQSILKKAFEGKLVLQEPSDEPASVLLARIKAEREMNKPENPPRRQPGKTRMKKARL